MFGRSACATVGDRFSRKNGCFSPLSGNDWQSRLRNSGDFWALPNSGKAAKQSIFAYRPELADQLWERF
jgi:hypothetical protein